MKQGKKKEVPGERAVSSPYKKSLKGSKIWILLK